MAYLPTTPAANFATSTAGVVDTGGKLSLVSTTPVANLPPVSMTSVTNNGNCRTCLPDYTLHRLVGRYDNPMPESTISSSQGLRILATGLLYASGFALTARSCKRLYTVKKVSGFPVPSRDVTYHLRETANLSFTL
jgi:hypothetical protein